jgi:UDP-GlcNAc:undecaprenyl-phosphate GlcNAc-1-phosphate transferase
MSYIDHLFSFAFWPWLWKVCFFSLVTFVLLKVFKSLGTKAKSQDAFSRWSSAIKPAVGGMVFFVGFLMAMLQLLFFSGFSTDYLFIFMAGVVAFGLGLWDDMRRISPTPKFAGQILTGILFALSGHATGFFVEPGQTHAFFQILDGLMVIIIVVAVMNSVNMLDNMDGISTIATMPVMLLPAFGTCVDGSMGMIMICALFGFLVFNWKPAKVYMGDSGSMLLGFITAWMVLGMDHCGENNIPSYNGLTTILLFLGAGTMFISDTLVVIIQRLRHKISPFQGGRDHTTHNLFYLGLKEWQIAVLFLTLGLIQLVLLFTFLEQLKSGAGIWAAGSTILFYFFLLFGFHLAVSFRNLRKGKYNYPS